MSRIPFFFTSPEFQHLILNFVEKLFTKLNYTKIYYRFLEPNEWSKMLFVSAKCIKIHFSIIASDSFTSSFELKINVTIVDGTGTQHPVSMSGSRGCERGREGGREVA